MPAHTYAAIDIGSNSIHMIVARLDAQRSFDVVDRFGAKAQLGAGMEGGLLNRQAIERGLDCLAAFAARLDQFDGCQLRVVATNALREAINKSEFIEPAEKLLGCPVRVISGSEEARLIYRAVSDAVNTDAAMLVADIGGGSTELALGQSDRLLQAGSVQAGCVSFLQYFPAGLISPASFEDAYAAACKAFQPLALKMSGHWQACVGTSGTLQAIEQVLIQQRLSSSGIERAALSVLRERLLDFTHIGEVAFAGLSESRREVFASGLAIGLALFDTLGIEQMAMSDRALREGVLLDWFDELSAVAATGMTS